MNTNCIRCGEGHPVDQTDPLMDLCRDCLIEHSQHASHSIASINNFLSDADELNRIQTVLGFFLPSVDLTKPAEAIKQFLEERLSTTPNVENTSISMGDKNRTIPKAQLYVMHHRLRCKADGLPAVLPTDLEGDCYVLEAKQFRALLNMAFDAYQKQHPQG